MMEGFKRHEKTTGQNPLKMAEKQNEMIKTQVENLVTELQNVNSFTQTKSFDSNFTPKKRLSDTQDFIQDINDTPTIQNCLYFFLQRLTQQFSVDPKFRPC